MRRRELAFGARRLVAAHLQCVTAGRGALAAAGAAAGGVGGGYRRSARPLSYFAPRTGCAAVPPAADRAARANEITRPAPPYAQRRLPGGRTRIASYVPYRHTHSSRTCLPRRIIAAIAAILQQLHTRNP